MRKERRISRATEHFTTGETNTRLPSDMEVEFDDGHSFAADMDGIDDPVTHANQVHNEEHGRTGREGIRSLSRAAIFKKLDDVSKTIKKLRDRS